MRHQTQSLPAKQPARLRVGILLARRFTLAALANFIDVLRLAADEGDRSRPILCSWRVVAMRPGPVESSCGLYVEAEDSLGDPTRFDYIAVVGGLIGEGQWISPEAEAWLCRAAASGVPLIGLCTGAFILARAGLMQGYRCCVSWFHREDFLELFDQMLPVSDQIFVVDRDRLTCSGGASTAHLAAFLVDRHIGRAAARKSLSIMIVDDALAAERPQPGLPVELRASDALVKRALLWMQQFPETPPTAERLARQLGVSRRTLERRFAEDLAISPAEAGRRMRLAQVRALLARGEKSVTQIAAETGFSDVSHLIRVFRAAEGITPEAWRRAQGGAGGT
ncbi:GlxA family transcriptional regulator [Albidovulum sediminicola]|uniref:GlxA family transcriptional regulator n=1 Tax=Albidovulum sediminicola TaxID=2984331 RepID=A0ABT2YYS7_9RHOB|nr:GlxA family transcriptional regulator [Defluviimonas sp. WL0075]MCV2863686.1 GlxA family transcriptional regulator [Defluviimonas sp. WL0075]